MIKYFPTIGAERDFETRAKRLQGYYYLEKLEEEIDKAVEGMGKKEGLDFPPETLRSMMGFESKRSYEKTPSRELLSKLPKRKARKYEAKYQKLSDAVKAMGEVCRRMEKEPADIQAYLNDLYGNNFFNWVYEDTCRHWPNPATYWLGISEVMAYCAVPMVAGILSGDASLAIGGAVGFAAGAIPATIMNARAFDAVGIGPLSPLTDIVMGVRYLFSEEFKDWRHYRKLKKEKKKELQEYGAMIKLDKRIQKFEKQIERLKARYSEKYL